LYERGGTGDIDALSRLGEDFPEIKVFVEQAEANRAARGVLQRIAPSSGLTISPSAAVPLQKVVRLFEDAQYRVIRSAESLQEALVDELETIAKTAHQHLSMLYTPRKKSNQKTLEEDALQTYIHCRLSDRLVDRVLDRGTTVVFLNREPQVGLDQRLDLRVDAPAVGGGSASVVIEIKWSTNPKVAESLSSQLAKRYLLAHQLTHGIYLVGWSGPGRWPKGVQPAPKPRVSVVAWQQALQAQADLFGKQHPEIAIAVLVMDLLWPPPQGGST
jgi:hypothetical protein